jgi:hypothetical protein
MGLGGGHETVPRREKKDARSYTIMAHKPADTETKTAEWIGSGCALPSTVGDPYR